MPLTVCPQSNVKLRVFDTMADHNLKQMLDKGICVTVNSDDPAYFGGYVSENYRAVQQALNLKGEEIYQLVRNSFEASFLTDEERAGYLARLDKAFSQK